jgi:hypothetical protein
MESVIRSCKNCGRVATFVVDDKGEETCTQCGQREGSNSPHPSEGINPGFPLEEEVEPSVDQALEDASRNYYVFRGCGEWEAKQCMKKGTMIPSASGDLIAKDWEVLEYGFPEVRDMQQDEIEKYLTKVTPKWAYKEGANVTTDYENSVGYGEYVLVIDISNTETWEASEHHIQVRYPAKAKIMYVIKGTHGYANRTPKVVWSAKNKLDEIIGKMEKCYEGIAKNELTRMIQQALTEIRQEHLNKEWHGKSEFCKGRMRKWEVFSGKCCDMSAELNTKLHDMHILSKVVHGYYRSSNKDIGKTAHSWVEVDGKYIVDITVDQFENVRSAFIRDIADDRYTDDADYMNVGDWKYRVDENIYNDIDPYQKKFIEIALSKPEIVLYHQTHKDNLDSILKNGLKAGGVEDGVHTVFGEKVSRVGSGKDYVHVRIVVPKDKVDNLYPEDATYYTHKVSDNADALFRNYMELHPDLVGGDIIYNGDIPKEWITVNKIEEVIKKIGSQFQEQSHTGKNL